MSSSQQNRPAKATEPSDSLNTKDLRRILGSSFLGSVIEYYDFILYATAASLIFDKVFFGNLTPGLALFASFGTLAVGYIARPLGGIVFGHFGDRLGRKKMLVLSMMMMGVATVAIGLLPTTATIGVAAPIILVLLRVVQGVAVGGEWGGATLMALEHAPASKRGFAASFANAGAPAGGLLATFLVSFVSFSTGDAFLEWGWRLPFIFSAVLIIIGMVIRLKVAETPIFQEMDAKATERQQERKTPISLVLKNHSRTVIITLIASLGFYTCQGVLTSWGVSEAAAQGVDRSFVLNTKGYAAMVTIVVCLLAAKLSDKYGRKTILTIGGIAGILWAFPAVFLMSNGTGWGFAVAVIVGNGVIQGILAGPIGAYISELFPANVRYTGASLAYQGSSTLGAGFTPMICTALAVSFGITAVGIFWVAILFIGLIAIRISPEGAALPPKNAASAPAEAKLNA
ncbi:MHS family MFS transporter [Glutamicibacter sp. MNS18]|uniref:MFS transporter n=1 Tax=Glutamicibacter sp. MNS18 TaxID=2989817 RepID=UPI00223608D4|nr:MFS transporter [Glutamicibacter sp. MNS18]MCW4467229.1 MHS family MFS transporter [Glutamicibacter sp. MNS18]